MIGLLRQVRARFRPAAPSQLLDPSAPEVIADPHRHFDAFRLRGPIHRAAESGSWIVLGYDAVHEALARPEHFSSVCMQAIDPYLIGADGPDHAQARRAAAPLLSSYFKAIAARADDWSAALIAPEFDAVADYAIPLSRQATSDLLGIARDDVEAVIRASHALWDSPDAAQARAEIARIALASPLYHRLIAEAGATPQLAASLIGMLGPAAAETIERLIARTTLALVGDVALLRTVREQPEQIPALIEEMMRVFPPEAYVVRVATCDTALGDVAIAQGDSVLLSLAAANRDPRYFEAPGEIRIGREGKPQLAFGAGAHQCIGAGLARRVAASAIRALCAPGRDLRAAEPPEGVPIRIIQRMPHPARVRVST